MDLAVSVRLMTLSLKAGRTDKSEDGLRDAWRPPLGLLDEIWIKEADSFPSMAMGKTPAVG